MALTANEIDVFIGQSIRKRREAMGVSQSRLSKHLGLTFSQVQKYEKGMNRIGSGRLFLIAKFLEVPIEYLFEGLVDNLQSEADVSRSNQEGRDLSVLGRAFLAISDLNQRRSVLALACVLADTDAE